MQRALFICRSSGTGFTKSKILIHQTLKLSSESSMESDHDLELLPSSPVHERKLKRLRKAARVPEPSHLPPSPAVFYESRKREEHLTVSNGKLGSENETQEHSPSPGSQPDFPRAVTVNDGDLGAKRVLDFDSVIDGESQEVRDLKTGDEFRVFNTDEVERKRRSLNDLPENKKKKRIVGSDGSEKKPKESATNKRKAEKVDNYIFLCC